MKPGWIVTLLCAWGTAVFWFPGLRYGWTGFLGGVFCAGLIYHWATQPPVNSRGRDTERGGGEHGND